MIKGFGSTEPDAEKALFIAPNATLVGDVSLGEGSSVWYNAVLRADENKIIVGRNSNIQDNSTIHVTREKPCTVGDNVSVGHNAVLHACTVEDECIIGMNATVLTGAVIGRGSIVAAGSVVREGTIVPEMSLVAGVPAQVKKSLGKKELAMIRENSQEYVRLAKQHSEQFI
ncbi:gamma carbonic anhydrase family protein [Candidatus Woesearchaeota archaeon]|nr:MAG: gamma carbonic anhydrase family protein [Candidatus Woesearchaeota archaeon]